MNHKESSIPRTECVPGGGWWCCHLPARLLFLSGSTMITAPHMINIHLWRTARSPLIGWPRSPGPLIGRLTRGSQWIDAARQSRHCDYQGIIPSPGSPGTGPGISATWVGWVIFRGIFMSQPPHPSSYHDDEVQCDVINNPNKVH